jgi:hypothetical protein
MSQDLPDRDGGFTEDTEAANPAAHALFEGDLAAFHELHEKCGGGYDAGEGSDVENRIDPHLIGFAARGPPGNPAAIALGVEEPGASANEKHRPRKDTVGYPLVHSGIDVSEYSLGIGPIGKIWICLSFRCYHVCYPKNAANRVTSGRSVYIAPSLAAETALLKKH